ncbi:trp RNA-binding attenuation protein MtrB [Candidatus Aerophobetes bacterium]|nr:trp RNA-binding attenuation protein MtrB [Candidatus Aerophobetes bacterium]
MEEAELADFIVVKALEDSVTIIGLTRGKETVIHHTEKLDKDEVWICQFTRDISAVKIRGKAEIFSKLGKIESGKSC